MTDHTKINKEYGLDISKEEAIQRIAKATQGDMVDQQGLPEIIEEGEAQTVLFKGKAVRQVFHANEWYFSIVDVIEAVTETDRPRQYWSDLKTQLSEKEDFTELYDKIVQLKLPSSDGKNYATDAVNVETLFRIVQSIPSKKAEPFKKWLAKVGYERIQEIQNPEIAVKRAILQWQIQGRPDDWIDARLRSIVTRKELTDEWKDRGIVEQEYGKLTNVISRKTFGVDTAAHKKIKGLKGQPLRDHMTDLELILTMLGEKSTTAIAKSTDAQGFQENKDAAVAGGKIAGSARRTLEEKLGKPIVSEENFLSSGKRVSDPQQLTAKPIKP